MKILRFSLFYTILPVFFIFNWNPLKAQCSANFTFVTGANGLLFLQSTGSNSVANTTYLWYSNGVLTYSAAAWSGTSTNITYTANGTYTLALQVISTAPSCSATTTQTVNITNATGCLLNAGFTTVNAGTGQINFFSTSTNTLAGSTFSWSFGDGSTGSGINPTHTYTNNGVYTISLTASNSGTCISTHSANISVCLSPVSAGFTFSVGSNGQVIFSSTSSPSGSNTPYTWTFFNQVPGTYTTIGVPTATYTFPANGFYTVSLSSGVLGCTSNTTQSLWVNTICSLSAGISHSAPSPTGQVNFTGFSLGTNSTSTYVWGFGDGGTGSGQYPVHTYTAPGVYNVTLTISNTGTCNATSTTTLNVQVCMMSAGFNSSIGNNGQVNFFSTSTGTTASTNYTWYIGSWLNPIVGVNIPTASGTFTVNSTYTVLLTVSNSPGCTFSNQQFINVTNASCTANSNFSLAPTATPQVWYAIPSTTSNISAAVWHWGDGSSSNGLFSSHNYSASGNYNICLSVTVNCTSTSSSCATYSIFRSNASVVQVIVVDPSLFVGIEESIESFNHIEVYPNPSNGSMSIQLSGIQSKMFSVNVYGVQGNLIFTRSIHHEEGTPVFIDVKDLPDGVYFLRIDDNRKYLNKKLIISKD